MPLSAVTEGGGGLFANLECRGGHASRLEQFLHHARSGGFQRILCWIEGDPATARCQLTSGT